jgi:predicted 3-demethylubiquinone-9 3-methyltransferase (glyoxalase superfamily)
LFFVLFIDIKMQQQTVVAKTEWRQKLNLWHSGWLTKDRFGISAQIAPSNRDVVPPH